VQYGHPTGHGQTVGGQVFEGVDVPKDGAFFSQVVHTKGLSRFLLELKVKSQRTQNSIAMQYRLGSWGRKRAKNKNK
jgi:hypothetical protein